MVDFLNMERETISEVEKGSAAAQRRDYFLPASIMIAGLMIAGALLYVAAGKDGGEKNKELAAAGAVGGGEVPQIESRDVILGDSKAPVTLIEYGDYQCPFCARFFNETEMLLRGNYIKTGKVRMVFRNFQFLGPESFTAAEAAECAKDQNKFWAYHDALYAAESKDGEEHNGNLNRDLFLRLAREEKLDLAAFTSCIDGKKYAAQVKSDSSAAQKMGVNSTPTTFVNGQKVAGALPYGYFKSLIDSLLEE